jgi:hypothetical protein
VRSANVIFYPQAMTTDLTALDARARLLRTLARLSGAACTAIGSYHFMFGSASVPGENAADATVDSRERFYGAIFAGYGAAWIRATRQRPIAATDVRALSGLMMVGGAGRLISAARTGRPHWFQELLTAVEFAAPGVLLALATAEERSASDRRRSARDSGRMLRASPRQTGHRSAGDAAIGRAKRVFG